MFDIAEGKPPKHFKPSFGSSGDWHIQYIDFDTDFIFVLAAALDPDNLDDDAAEGGLFVFENSDEGRLIYNDSICKLVCLASWEIDGHGMDDLRYGEKVLQDCSSLGIPVSIHPGAKEHQWQYRDTTWCAAVHPDWSTQSLVLCGLGTLLVIPNYKRAFRKVQQSEKRRPRVRVIGVGAGYAQEGTPHLAVANGAALFIASVSSPTPVTSSKGDMLTCDIS